MLLCRENVQYPAFTLGSSKLVVLFLGLFLYLLSRIFPNCTCLQLFLVPCSSLYFVDQGEVCSGAPPNSGIQPVSPSWQADSFLLSHLGSPWIDAPNQISLAVWQQWEWSILLYRGPSILTTIGTGGTPPFPGFEKNLIPRVYLWKDCSFLCILSGSWCGTLWA